MYRQVNQRCFLRLCLFSVMLLGSVSAQWVSAQDDSKALLNKILLELEKSKAAQAQMQSEQQSPAGTSNRSVAIGQSVRPIEPPKPILETRVYDLADMFAIAPSHTAHGFVGWDSSPLLDPTGANVLTAAATGATGGMGGMGGFGGGMGGMFNVHPSVQNNRSNHDYGGWQPTPKSLIEAIEKTVDAKWESSGGEEGLHWLGSSLIVNAFPATHAPVKNLLDLVQSRWNARSTFEIELHWLWLSFREERDLARRMSASESSTTRSIDTEDLLNFIDNLEKKDGRPSSVHARVHGHNGQTVPWVSGEQHRSVSSWDRLKGELVPMTTIAQRGIACEVTPMLAHATDHATLIYRGRWVEDSVPPVIEKADSAPWLEKAPRPDADRIVGQSLATTVRLPVGRAAILGSGSSTDPRYKDWMLVTIAGAQLVSPRNKIAE
jgi:hypothetical protein